MLSYQTTACRVIADHTDALFKIVYLLGYRNRGRYRFFFDHGGPTEVKYYELTFHKRYRDLAIKSYLPYVLERAKAIREEVKTLKLYTNNEDEMWTPVKLRHPATFKAVAMDEEKKKALIDDLSRFVQRKEYYKRIGKAWKRGYLLHGPPGTGKSTLIAAMANFLRFDIYDLELTEVKSNAMLRSLLINTTSRSILVIEDIDCSVDLQQRDKEKKPKRKEDGPPNNDESKVGNNFLFLYLSCMWSLFSFQLTSESTKNKWSHEFKFSSCRLPFLAYSTSLTAYGRVAEMRESSSSQQTTRKGLTPLFCDLGVWTCISTWDTVIHQGSGF